VYSVEASLPDLKIESYGWLIHFSQAVDIYLALTNWNFTVTVSVKIRQCTDRPESPREASFPNLHIIAKDNMMRNGLEFLT
jgi:hypothetical protein